MKNDILNNGLQPPERTERDADGQLQDLLEWVRKTYKPTDFWDMYEHDREVAIRFHKWMMDYNSVHLVDLLADKPQTTMEEMFERFCKQ
jgi:hypothetical protein